jgi:hypothetical protein
MSVDLFVPLFNLRNDCTNLDKILCRMSIFKGAASISLCFTSEMYNHYITDFRFLLWLSVHIYATFGSLRHIDTRRVAYVSEV